VLVTGEQGQILRTTDGGKTWLQIPTITSNPLFSVVFRGGDKTWLAGGGGAILKRTEDRGGIRIPRPSLPPILRSSQKKQPKQSLIRLADDGDIPRAVPPEIKKQQ
jgi:hypothetical protein